MEFNIDPIDLPVGVQKKEINIFSDGSSMSGDIFSPEDKGEGKQYPGLVLCHGWGGLKNHLNAAYAPWFAEAGFVVLTFDYRGWGTSDGRLVALEKEEPDDEGLVRIRARVIRNLVDPLDQVVDILACLDWLSLEPGVDKTRLGLWGSSYGGGNVVFVEAHEKRVKCIVAQVAGMDSAGIAILVGGLEAAQKIAGERARGERPTVPQQENEIPGLDGTPHISRMSYYRPVEEADKIMVPILIIDAEKEELFDRTLNGGLLYTRIAERNQNKIPVKYEIFKGMTHYQIYEQGLKKARKMAIDWFVKYL